MKMILYRDNMELVVHYCPGCKRIHTVRVDGPPSIPGNHKWQLTGTPDNPSLHPSVRFFYPESAYKDNPDLPWYQCHYNVKNGRLEFHSDCSHELKGQTIDMPELTESQLEFYN